MTHIYLYSSLAIVLVLGFLFWLVGTLAHECGYRAGWRSGHDKGLHDLVNRNRRRVG